MATAGAAGGPVPGYLGRVLDEDGSPIGTCFQIVPGVLVTAWHVLKRLGKAAVGAQVAIDPLAGGAAAEAAVKRLDKAHDLAVLACDMPLAASAGNLAATDQVEAQTDVTVTGHGVVEGSGRVLRSLRTIGRWAGPVMWRTRRPSHG